MKFFVFVCFFLTSCSVPNYIVQNDLQTTGVDFTSGNWLLGDVGAPGDVREQITMLAKENFRAAVGDRFQYLHDTSGLLLVRNIDLQPTKLTLGNIKKGTGFDYFVNIRAEDLSSDFGTIDLTPHKLDQGGKNSASVVIEIYDLNLREIIYAQKVIASVTRHDDNNDVHVAKSTNGLIIKAYKKLFSDIKSKSVQ